MKSILYASAALALAISPAVANPIQVNHSGSPSQSQVYGDGSSANSNLNNVTGGTAYGGSSQATAHGGRATARGGRGGKGGTSNVTVNGAGSGGGTDYGRFPAASAVAPSVANFNPCSGSSASGAVQTGLFGLSIGTGGGFDNACRLHMLGQDAAAVAYLCRVNGDIRQAYKDIGQPCPQDRPRATLVAEPAPPVRKYRYDWCYTRDPGNVRQAEECRASGV